MAPPKRRSSARKKKNARSGGGGGKGAHPAHSTARRKRKAQAVGRESGTDREGHPTPTSELDPGSELPAVADVLFRCAIESCRQHHRLAHLVERAASELEQQLAWKVARLCDGLLESMTGSYAAVATRSAGQASAELTRRANALWHASRAFTNRFLDRDRLAGGSGPDHSTERFRELNLEFELDASAVLNLKQAVDAYRRLRPEADFTNEN